MRFSNDSVPRHSNATAMIAPSISGVYGFRSTLEMPLSCNNVFVMRVFLNGPLPDQQLYFQDHENNDRENDDDERENLYTCVIPCELRIGCSVHVLFRDQS